jgi:NitT/TauT family transport system substrate-binding protein
LRLRKASIGLAVAAVLTMTGCSALGGPSTDNASGPLQKVKVSILLSTDLPPFWLAKDEGYFAAEGLDVDFNVAETGDKALTKAVSGESDIVFSTYPLFVKANSSGAGDLQVVADGTSATPNSNLIITVPTSPVKTIQDLKGHSVAVTSKNATSELLTKSVLIDHGIDPATVTFKYMGLPNIPPALQQGEIDAGYVPEPFIHQAAQSIGATRVIDVASGGTQDFPIGGYFATRKYVHDNPKVVAAFQRAMVKGVQAARTDRVKLNEVASKNIKNLTIDVAQLMELPRYEIAPDPRRLQRVPDLMLKLGALNSRVDIAPMIAKQQGS